MKFGDILLTLQRLQNESPDLVFPYGFKNPHSYRGSYDELAFEPAVNISIQELVEICETEMDTIEEGWKGGEYLMHDQVNVNIANVGDCGVELTSKLFEMMIGMAEMTTHWWKY